MCTAGESKGMQGPEDPYFFFFYQCSIYFLAKAELAFKGTWSATRDVDIKS